MSLLILFHFLCTQHVSDINISIIRFEQCPCCRLQAACNTDTTQTQPQQIANKQRTEKKDLCGNSTAQLQAHDEGDINVRNMLST